MRHDQSDPIAALTARIRELETEVKKLKTISALRNASISDGGRLRIYEGAAIVAILGALPGGGQGIAVPHGGGMPSLESVLDDQRSEIDGLNQTLGPGGAYYNWVTAVSNAAAQAYSHASAAHNRMNSGGDINSWIGQVSGVAWDGVNRAINAANAAAAAQSAANNAQSSANNAYGRADSAYGYADSAYGLAAQARQMAQDALTVANRAAYAHNQHNHGSSPGNPPNVLA